MPEQRETMLELERDALLSRTELPYRIKLYPLGFPTLIESNSHAVISSLEKSWNRFRQEFDFPPIHHSVIVSSSEARQTLSPPVFRCRRHLLSVTADEANFASCDLNSGYGCAWVTEQTVADSVYLRDSFTEALVLAMLNTRHLAPVHAACVVRDGAGVLLSGDSGAGKSSLALACALRGWNLLCDDASFMVRSLGGHTLVGNPFLMRFKPEGLKLFPQLGNRSSVKRINGKATIHLKTAEFPEIEPMQRAQARYLVFLQRGAHGEARLIRRRDDGLHLLRLHAYGSAQDIEEQDVTIRSLSSLPAFDFYYSGLEDAVDRLNLLACNGG